MEYKAPARFVRPRKCIGVRIVGLVLALGVGALLLGCSSFGGDQNTFNPEGDIAQKQLDIFLIALYPAIVVFFIVGGALVYALLRYRRRDDTMPEQVHGNMRLEIVWTVLPTLLLIGLAVPMVAAIIDIGRAPGDDALRVDVTGQQFSWFFEYPDELDKNGKPLRVLDDLRIPVDRDVFAHIESIDVIHSFWVPKLAGKIDAVPGRTNKLKFNATAPGTFSGQCAEFCGLRHAFMKFTVIACSEDEFSQWVEQKKSGAEETACAKEES